MAADKLGLSQPAVSSALNRMRRLFDDPLFVRGAGGMEPTRKAMLLAEAVALGLNTIRAGVATSTSFDPSSSTRQFRIAMTDVGEIIFLPRLMQALARSAPSITVHVIEHGLVNYEDLLETGEIDIAIGRFQLNPSFSSQHIHSSNFAVVLRSDHPLIDHASDGTPVLSYESYLQASHITVQAPGASGDPIVHALRGSSRDRRNRYCNRSLPVEPELQFSTYSFEQFCRGPAQRSPVDRPRQRRDTGAQLRELLAGVPHNRPGSRSLGRSHCARLGG
ncbi:DNA-binding transcriptional LysR family regulator [Bradyrhizobium elkanii]